MPTTEIERVERLWPDFSPLLFVPRTEEEYQRLVTLLDALIDRVGEEETHPLASLMDVVGALIERYEDQNPRSPERNGRPTLAALCCRMAAPSERADA